MGILDSNQDYLIQSQAGYRYPNPQSAVAERVGFEPTVAFDHTAFRERHLKPLGHLSSMVTPRGFEPLFAP